MSTAHELQEEFSVHIPYNRGLDDVNALVEEFVRQIIEYIIAHSTDGGDCLEVVHIA